MARIRTIKPEFWTDAKTGTLSSDAKCLFLGLLNYADDYGVIEFQPVEYRAKIFPYHSDTTTTLVNTLLIDELLPRGLVILFSHTEQSDETKRYLFIRNFAKHQVVNKPSNARLKGWKKDDTPETYSKHIGCQYQEIGAGFNEGSDTIPAPLPEGYLLERKGKEGNGKEEEKKEAAHAALDLAPDPETDLYRRGKEVCGKNSGGLIKQVLQAKKGSVPLARAAIEQAATKHDPREYLGGVVRARDGPNADARERGDAW